VGHGVAAGLSIAKSADAANAGATQQSPAQREQSARRCFRASIRGKGLLGMAGPG